MAAQPSTTTGSGCEKRGLEARAPPSAQRCLELFSDRVVDRVWPASADRNRETHRAEQQDELVAALANQEAADPVGCKQRDQHFDCQRRRKKAREQADDKANPTDRFKEHRCISKSQRGLESVLRHGIGRDCARANFELAPYVHHHDHADHNAHQRVGNIAPGLVKRPQLRIEKFCLASASHGLPLVACATRVAAPSNQVYITTGGNEFILCAFAARKKIQVTSSGTRSVPSATGMPSIRQRPFSTLTRPSATSCKANG